MIRSLIIITIFLLHTLTYSQATDTSTPLKKSKHDLNLPQWGPYTKKYIGISHIPDMKKGIRFDLSIFPGFYRRKVDIPNVMFESGYHPWMATADLDFFTFRHELEWKDRVYTDISYMKMDNEKSPLVRMELVNNTDLNQNLSMNIMASMHFPSIQAYKSDTPLQITEVNLPENAFWIDATEYTELNFAQERPQDNLVYDGKLRGEIRVHDLVLGRGIGRNFGKDPGDRILFKLPKSNNTLSQTVVFRYRVKKDHEITLVASGILNDTLKITGTGEFEVHSLKVNKENSKDASLSLTSLGDAEFQFDGFSILPEKELEQLEFKEQKRHFIPEILKSPVDNALILKYKNTDQYYGLHWDYEDYVVREVFAKDLDVYYRIASNNHVSKKLHGSGEGHFENVFLRPIFLKPNSKKLIYLKVHSGTLDEVTQALKSDKWDKSLFERRFQTLKSKSQAEDYLSSGESYRFGIQLMKATLATNVVYPVYTQKSYIRHRTPGRWWDSLYSWDSGFIGLGLLEMDTQQAIDNLNAYLMDVDNQSAFLHHGTPLPVQHYLYNEIWNRTQSKEFLRKFYPSLKRYHNFLAGKEGSSTTNSLGSDMLKTWDYFYNSGGWDDYPPQHQVHRNKMQATTSPVINTAHAIRTAKIMKQAALILGLDQDVRAYDKDIKRFSNALQKYSWDKTSGYFGYVTHDAGGKPSGILRTAEGENFNKGLGGASPLISGICSPEQQKELLQKLQSSNHLWSTVGLSAVDQSSSYFREDGYWNGTVWMPHQWFFFKAMLDLGESEFAFKIAKTALDTWKRETGATYNTMEHFIINTGRGAGWHQFGGLSSPVVNWFYSFYVKGKLTTGYDFWVKEKEFSNDYSTLEATLIRSETKKGNSSVIVTLQEKEKYNVQVQGKPAEFQQLHPGCLMIKIPNTKQEVTIKVF